MWSEITGASHPRPPPPKKKKKIHHTRGGCRPEQTEFFPSSEWATRFVSFFWMGNTFFSLLLSGQHFSPPSLSGKYFQFWEGEWQPNLGPLHIAKVLSRPPADHITHGMPNGLSNMWDNHLPKTPNGGKKNSHYPYRRPNRPHYFTSCSCAP